MLTISERVMSHYFDIGFKGRGFYIVESSCKPLNEDSSLAILQKIEYVVKNYLEYESSHIDVYSKLSKKEIYEILNNASSTIIRRYYSQQILGLVSKNFLNSAKKINALHRRIQDYIHPAQLFPLPYELIQKIAEYMEYSDLKSFAQLNRLGRVHAYRVILHRSKEYGYQGLDYVEAVKHTDALFKEVIYLSDLKVIPSKYLSYKMKMFLKNKLNPEQTLLNLRDITSEDLFFVLSNEEFYSRQCVKLRKRFNLKICRKVSSVYKDTVVENRKLALFLACKNHEKDICEMLLKLGANVNLIDQHGYSPLLLAVRENNKDIVSLLIQYGADVNITNSWQNTPLILSPSAAITFLLLHSGKVQMIDRPSSTGLTALHLAVKKRDLDQVKVLLSYGANIDARNRDNYTPLALAVVDDQAEIVSYLIKKGADVNAITDLRDSILMLSPSAKITLLLLNSGRLRNINHRGSLHRTALHLALQRADFAQAQALMDHGAEMSLIELF